MAEHDPFPELRELARVAEEYAHPLPAERVRQLGQRRRTRRQVGLVAAALVAVVVAGGAVASITGLRTNESPGPVATPTVATPSRPSASPNRARAITEDNLITAAEVPVLGKERFVETPAAPDRRVDQSTVCVPEDGLNSVPAAVLGRSFRADRRWDGTVNPPEPPFGGNPTVYTNVLQLGSTSAAAEAYATYRQFLKMCDAIGDRGDTRLGVPLEWIDVPTGVRGARGGFTEVTWRAREDTSESGYFESVGLALVGDRLAVTVSLQYGQDYNSVGYRPEGDPDLGLPPHPQFGLVKAAAERLTR